MVFIEIMLFISKRLITGRQVVRIAYNFFLVDQVCNNPTRQQRVQYSVGGYPQFFSVYCKCTAIKKISVPRVKFETHLNIFRVLQ